METKDNKHISVAYELFAVDSLGRHLFERVPADKPLTFITGFGIMLSDFEDTLAGLNAGENFNFTIESDKAYGDYDDERVLELDREMFTIDGKFDRERIYIDAIVPLMNQEGDRFMARVLDIRDNTVVVDLNHPLAGKALNFVGSVVESRQATEEEVHDLILQLTGSGCGGCGGCGDGSGECGEGCNNQNCNKDGKGGCCHA